MYIAHHGIKGQQWGVRNGPPYPLSRQSPAQLQAKKIARTKDDVDDIVKSLSLDEKIRLGMSMDDLEYNHYLDIEEGEHVMHRILQKCGDIPVSFFDLFDDNETINVALATRAGDEYRGKGYGYKGAKQAMDWLKENPDIWKGRTIVWGVRSDNEGSIKIAKKLGFEFEPGSESDDGWVNYVYKGTK